MALAGDDMVYTCVLLFKGENRACKCRGNLLPNSVAMGNRLTGAQQRTGPIGGSGSDYGTGSALWNIS